MIVQTYERSDAWASPAKFFDWFSVDPSRFIMRSADDRSWNTVNRRLNYPLVERALQCQATVGFFSRKWTRCLILDVDLHSARAPWTTHPEHLIRARELLAEAFDQPSLFVRTPRGFHMIYFLSEKRHTSTLRNWAAARASQIDLSPCTLDIAPSHSRGLRIPGLANSRTGDFEIPGESLMRIYAAPDLRRRGGTGRPGRKSNHGKANLSQLTFRAGESNETYLRAIARLYRQGVSEAEACETLAQKLVNDGYSGDLSRDAELVRRVASSYRNLSRKNFQGAASADRARKQEMPEWIWRVALSSPFKHPQKERFAEFLAMLHSWQSRLSDERRGDGDAYEERCQLYPGHGRRARSGAIPLPSVLMRRAYQRYPRFTAYLQELGYLEPMFAERRPFQHDSELSESVPGLCRYFTFKPATISSEGEPQSYCNIVVVSATPALLCEMKQRHTVPRQSLMRQRVLACLIDGYALEDDIIRGSKGNITKKQIALLCSRDPDLRRSAMRSKQGSPVPVIHLRTVKLEELGFRPHESNMSIVERGIRDALLLLRDEVIIPEQRSARLKAMTRLLLATELRNPAFGRQFSTLFQRAVSRESKEKLSCA